LCCDLGRAGSRHGVPVLANDLSAAVREREASGSVRWVWPSTAELYPRLVRGEAQVARCDDVGLAEAVLLGREGRYGEPASLAAAWAGLRGLPVPRHHAPPAGAARQAPQQALFEAAAGTSAGATLDALIAVHAAELAPIAADENPAPFGTLVAAESAGGPGGAGKRLKGGPGGGGPRDEVV